MKKLECLVCGYVHEGDALPEECPVCGADPDQFEGAIEKEVAQEAAPQPVAEKVTTSGVRRWKCTICDYIHEGDSPPDECPICGAGPEMFVEIDANDNEIAPQEITGSPTPSTPKPAAVTEPPQPSFIARMVMKFHIHPISVHFPNGILPLAVIFLAVAVFLGFTSFEAAAYYNMVFVLITMPLVLVTGFIEWKNRYRGAKTFVFITKITCSAIVTICLVVLVAWRFVDPTVAADDSPFRLIYFGIAATMIGATGIAGHLGGKLVFGGRGR